MPYLNLDLDYFTCPKVRRLVGLLGKDAEVLPIRLWCYVGKHHPDCGKLAGYTPQEIESAIAWEGEKGKAVAALVKIGFLHEEKSGYKIHDWLEHSGHLSAFKERAIKANLVRWGRYRESYKDTIRTPKAPLKESSLPTLPTKEKETNKEKDFSLSEIPKSGNAITSPTAKVDERTLSDVPSGQKNAALGSCASMAKDWKAMSDAIAEFEIRTYPVHAEILKIWGGVSGRKTDASAKDGAAKIAVMVARGELTKKEVIRGLREFHRRRNEKDYAIWGLVGCAKHFSDFLTPEKKESAPPKLELPPPATPEQKSAAIARGRAEFERERH
jgi:hypothetical protein